MLNGAAAGFVRIGLVPSVINTLLRPTLAAIGQRAPEIQVQVVEGAGDEMLGAVANGRVDFAIIGSINPDFTSDIIVSPICEEEVCVLAHPDHPVFRRRNLLLSDLTGQRWILPEKGNAIWVGFDALFRRNGLNPPTPAVTTNSVHTLKSMVHSGQYLTMMTRVIFALEEENNLVRPLPLPETSWKREIVLVRRSHHQAMPAEKLVLSELMRHARALAC
ncbi:MAG: substrate-binding domain-containing protein [Sulfitobacter dubius]|uniref:substrate-binding domain-containing protein n=1 Tax=Parasphingorhabdus sp. TaxID=2709688 RepID=UPI00329A1B2B